jgi:hypothetical protein
VFLFHPAHIKLKKETWNMTTTNAAIAALVARVGFDPGRMRAVARKLTDAGRLPPGSPGKSPELEPEHVVDLIIGSAVDVPLRAVADAVRTYRSLGLPGHDASRMPASVAARYHCAGDHLDVLGDMAAYASLDARADVSKLKLEVVSNWPEIGIHHVDGSVQRFLEASTLASHWQASGHRTSTVINGAAFVDAMRDLFCKE